MSFCVKIFRLIAGLGFIAFGLATIIVVGQTSKVECSRLKSSQVMCVKKSKWLGLVPLKRQLLGKAQKSWVKESCDDDGCSYLLHLKTSEGDMPLAGYYSSGQNSKEKKADRINTYLREGWEENLEVVIKGYWSVLGGLLGGVIFLSFGVGILAGQE